MRPAARSPSSGRGAGALLALFLLLALPAADAAAGERFVAFSLKEAAHQLRATRSANVPEALRIAGITRVAGMVHDPKSQDIIVVGQSQPADPPLSLDDFVVALRAVLVHKRWPLVSIDPTENSPTTRLQTVRFEGGIAQSGFGKAMYEADVLLKDMVLGRRSANIWGMKSYVALTEDELRRTGGHGLSSVRFWYVTDDSRMTARGNVFAIDELRIALHTVHTETQPAASAPADPPAQVSGDSAGEHFARDFNERFDDLALAYRPLARLRQLFALTALASGVQSLGNGVQSVSALPHLDFWLKEYTPVPVETAEQHPLITISVDVPKDGRIIDLHLSGGVQLSATIRRLKDGDVSALEEAVLQSRPSAAALYWRVPLDGWRLPGYPESLAVPDSMTATLAGTTVMRSVGSGAMPSMHVAPRPSPPSLVPNFATWSDLTRQIEVPRVSGVMLASEATVVDGADASNRATAFALLASGEGAGLTPLAHRRFVTALWAVYFSDEDPGISIDPIAWGAKRQLVRYIGRVVNTDLGRVMREADYTMKKWAVGTERPDIKGFKDVDSLAGKRGTTLSDAFRRFWFVPTELRFRATDSMLVFESGQMELKTESNIHGRVTPPIESDERFAGFFTENYEPIAEKYPVFDELFEYARYVSLANYLKSKHIPLQWFLLSHHDQVLTEMSAGSVETLSKGSHFADDIRIEGGVDLPGNYVLDKTTAAALHRAAAAAAPTHDRMGGRPTAATDVSRAAPASFRYDNKAYSIVPQHSIASGKDRRGTRYQTDIAVRDGESPGLEVVRFFRPDGDGERVGAEMGKGWRLMIPLRAYAIGPADQPFGTVLVPRQWRIRDQLTGRDEVLTLDTRVYAQHGYRPTNMQQSRFMGMFWTVGGLLRLGDKFGNEFWFDASGLLQEMHFSKNFGVRFEYDLLDVPASARAAPPLRLVPEGSDTDDRFGTTLPKKLRLIDATKGTREAFVLNDWNGRLMYLPEAVPQRSQRFISLRIDGSHVLTDIDGSETWFDLDLRFVRQRSRIVSGMVQGLYELNQEKTDLVFRDSHRVRFEHEFDGQAFRVAHAALLKRDGSQPVHTVSYRYDDDGMLTAAVVAGHR